MGGEKKLTPKQLAVINDMFAGRLDEQRVLKKHGISRNIYSKWQRQEVFKEEFKKRVEAAYLQSELILARYITLAAAKLVQLTESENQETARKACLDIISLQGTSGKKKTNDKIGKSKAVLKKPLSAETCERLLKALAQEKNK